MLEIIEDIHYSDNKMRPILNDCCQVRNSLKKKSRIVTQILTVNMQLSQKKKKFKKNFTQKLKTEINLVNDIIVFRQRTIFFKNAKLPCPEKCCWNLLRCIRSQLSFRQATYASLN